MQAQIANRQKNANLEIEVEKAKYEKLNGFKIDENADSELYLETMLQNTEDMAQDELAIYTSLYEKLKKKREEDAKDELKLKDAVENKKKDLMVDAGKTAVNFLEQLYKNYYDNQEYRINKETEVFKTQEEEKGKEVDVRLKDGVISEQDAEDEKARIKEYYEAAYKEQERKKNELETQKFYADQAMSLAKIAMNTAEAVSKTVAGTGFLGIPLTTLVLALGVAQAGVVLAQQPPKFAKGGIMPYDGIAEVGDGGKHEFWVSPSGDFGITPNTSTYMHLDKGTVIKPDINKIDLMSIIGMSKPYRDDAYDMKRLEKVMVSIDKKMSNQKHTTTIKGMTLVEQFNQSEKLKSRTRSLMN